MARITEDLRKCYPQEGPIYEYIEWARRLSHAPPSIHLACLVPLVSYELTRRQLWLSMFDPLNVWLGIIAPPASVKSTSLKAVRDFSRDWYEIVLGEDLAPRPWVSLEGSLPGVLHSIAEKHDKTMPYVAGILHHTEASKVFSSTEGVMPTLCQIYDGEPIERNYRYLQKAKAEGEAVVEEIPPTRMSAVLTTTRAALQRVLQLEMLEGGLYSRLLWLQESIPEEDLQPWPERDEQGRYAVLQSWARWYRSLDGLRTGHNLASEIIFAETALEFLRDKLFKSLRPHMTGESMEASVALRVMQHAARIAACYAASRLSSNVAFTPRGAQIVVQEDDVTRAANLTLRAFHSAINLGKQGQIQFAAHAERRAMLARAVRKAGRDGLTRRDLHRFFQNHLSAKQIDELVVDLVAAEEIVEVRWATRGRPAMRLFAFELYDEVVAVMQSGGTMTKQ